MPLISHNFTPGISEKRVYTREVLFAAAVVLGPILLFWHLHRQWDPNGEYAYGWAVPMLAIFLYKSRWDDRPPPSAPLEGAAFLAILFALVTLPARWLQEAAPERSLCACAYAVACLGISLSLIALMGGSAWLRWFSFPFAFILTVVPWPHTLETLVSNSLMRGTAGATVEILCLIGVPSSQSGNLVHIETGVIDIAEACSGIRSLQAMVMISLFLGELFRLTPARRLLLIAAGLTVTLLANVIRTATLSSIGFSQGMSAVDRYHDAAGFAVLAFSLSGALIVAYMLRPTKTPTPISAPDGIGLTFPLKLCIALLIGFFVEEISVETWYRLHEPKWQGWSWSVHWPKQSKGFHSVEIPKDSLRILRCDESQAATWTESDGSDWTLYWIRWNPGNAAAETAKVHRPDVCLTSAGAILEKDLGIRLSSVGGLQIPFHSYTFRMGEKTLYVFFCLFEETTGAPATTSPPQFEGMDMIQRALKGQRHVGLQSLELALSGYPSEQNAQKVFETHLGKLLQISSSPVPGTKE